MAADRADIGLSPDSQERVEEIMSKGWFADAQDLARLGFATAVRANVSLGIVAGPQTRWARSKFDPSGEMQAVVSALYPTCDTPIRQMEYLIQEGIRLIHQRMAEGAGPADLIT